MYRIVSEPSWLATYLSSAQNSFEPSITKFVFEKFTSKLEIYLNVLYRLTEKLYLNCEQYL